MNKTLKERHRVISLLCKLLDQTIGARYVQEKLLGESIIIIIFISVAVAPKSSNYNCLTTVLNIGHSNKMKFPPTKADRLNRPKER